MTWTIKDDAAAANLLELRRANADSAYGLAALRYMDAWGNMMQDFVDTHGVAALKPEIIQNMSHEADTEGITGFMHSVARSALRSLWIHGHRIPESSRP